MILFHILDIEVQKRGAIELLEWSQFRDSYAVGYSQQDFIWNIHPLWLICSCVWIRAFLRNRSRTARKVERKRPHFFSPSLTFLLFDPQYPSSILFLFPLTVTSILLASHIPSDLCFSSADSGFFSQLLIFALFSYHVCLLWSFQAKSSDYSNLVCYSLWTDHIYWLVTSRLLKTFLNFLARPAL